MAFSGMNVPQVQAQAKILIAQGEDISKLVTQIDHLVTELQGAWHGEDSKKFANQWNSDIKGRIQSAAKALKERGTQAQAQAKQQAGTSASL